MAVLLPWIPPDDSTAAAVPGSRRPLHHTEEACLLRSFVPLCQSSKKFGKIACYRNGILTFHAYERYPNYRHGCIQSVKPIPLPSAVRSEQEYPWRIYLDFIFAIEIDYLFCFPENDVVIANESFATIVRFQKFKVTLRKCHFQLR